MSLIHVLYNRCYGGFSISTMAMQRYKEESGWCIKKAADDDDDDYDSCHDVNRTDPLMVRIVQEMKEAANGFCADLGMVQVEEKYEKFIVINEYDGAESVSIDYNQYKIARIKKAMLDDDDDNHDDGKTLKERIACILAEEETKPRRTSSGH